MIEQARLLYVRTAGKVLKTCKIDNTIGIWSSRNNALYDDDDELFYYVDNRCVYVAQWLRDCVNEMTGQFRRPQGK